ncbi:YcaO-like family protein [Longirhabdus pacifica]|uniref:YcaO-like family protein n=1 Tax=Longirhabdus pacifica TaxID=2305227 RepID=UPI0010088438|nr:YcaO-like family protein [Longirhabdus pacifica]
MAIAAEQNHLMPIHTFANGTAYMERGSYVFIGPLKMRDEDACVQCFLTALEQNDSDYLYALRYEPVKQDCEAWFEAQWQNVEEKLVNTVYVWNKHTCHMQVKSIYKHPLCPACVEDDVCTHDDTEDLQHTLPFHDGRTKNVLHIMEQMEQMENVLLDADTGIGKRLFRDVESSLIPMYGIQSYMGSSPYHSYGRSSSLITSKMAAKLEMIERFASMVPYFKQDIRASYDDLLAQGKEVIDPTTFALEGGTYTQLHYTYDPTKAYYWTSCFHWRDEQAVLLPEQFVYYDNQLLHQEERFLYETSNGTALGGTLQEAIIYGVFEALERDHFLLHWYTQKLPRRIDVTSIKDDRIHGILCLLAAHQFEMYLFDITLEVGIPTVWVLARSQSEHHHIHLYNAAGSNYDPEKAIFSGLVEVVTSIFVYDKLYANKEEELAAWIGNPQRVVSMEDHIKYYALKENAGAFDFLFNHIQQCQWITTEEMKPSFEFDYEQIKQRVYEYHPDIYVANMSNQITKQMGLYVAKVFIPSLQPITFGVQNERINWERLSQYGGAAFIPYQHLQPHPFP